MGDWNFADVYEAIAERVPDAPCQVQGDRVVSWADFDRRADALAADLLEAGLGRQAKVGAYLYNCAEYLETYMAVFKAGLAPFNTNYRYGPDEISYLFDNADAEAIVFHASFAPLIGEVLGVETLPIACSDDGRSHSMRIGDAVDLEFEDFAGYGESSTMWVDGVTHPANARLTIGRASRARFDAFGISESHDGKNTHFTTFQWNA